MVNTFFPFFDPEDDLSAKGRRIGRRALAFIPIRALIPNLITLLSLCMGLTAIRMSLEQRYELALICIVIAALLDSLDGRVARMLQSTSRFGSELDSLADLVNFGVAPVVFLYSWSLKDLGSIGWLSMMCFAIATALRLARFNSSIGISKPKWQEGFAVGMPAPAGALTVMLPFYLDSLEFMGALNLSFLTLFYVFLVSFMMVSKIPTYASKIIGSGIPRDIVVPLFFLIMLYMTLLLSYPWLLMTLSTFVYWLSIPFCAMHFQKMKMLHGYVGDLDSSLYGDIPGAEAPSHCDSRKEDKEDH